jgi:hypothetical protein
MDAIRSHQSPHLLKLLGYATAYGCALVTGTALLIGATASPAVGASGQTLTASEVTMQQAAVNALLANASQARLAVQVPQGLLLAAGPLSNDKRGF